MEKENLVTESFHRQQYGAEYFMVVKIEFLS
jgi:hypothetical protein